MEALVDMKPRLYYAHSKAIYDQPDEMLELRRIKKHYPGYTVVNPNGMFKSDGEWTTWLETGIQSMELVVFTSYLGFVGKGVYDELYEARRLGKDIVYLTKKGRFVTNYRLGRINPRLWKWYCRVWYIEGKPRTEKR